MARVPIPTGAVITDDPAAPPAGRVPIPAGATVTDEPAPAIGRGKAALTTTLQGTSAGFSDELGGVGGAIGEALHAVVHEGRLPTGAELKNAYTGSRDLERKYVKQAQEAYPVQSLATEIGGSLALPLPGLGGAKTAIKAVGLGRKALLAAKALAPAAAIGGVAGAGYQESGQGQTADAGDVAGSATTGAALGAGGALVAKGLGAAWRKLIPQKGQEEIRTGVLDMLARADAGSATPTAKKRVGKAGAAIFDELVTGPDGEAVKKIVYGASAKDGLEQLQPIIDRVAAANDSHYARFARAGKHVVDVPNEYAPRLRAAEASFRREGDSRMADGLAAVREKMISEGQATIADGGETHVKWLRSHTTTMQDAAASKIGGLNEHEKARTAKLVAREAKHVFDQVLDSKAAGDAGLTGAAAAIRKANRRMFALLSMEDVLESRALKEEVTGGKFEQLGKRLATTAKGAAGGGLLGAVAGGGHGAAGGGEGGDIVDNALSWGTLGAVAGGAAAMAPRLGKGLDRRLTGKALDRLRAAATGAGTQSPGAAIKAVAAELGMPERQARAAYIRLVMGGKKDEPVRP